jgi:hypothetical protein
MLAHCGGSMQSGAAQQVEEKRFRLVVAMVGKRHEIGAVRGCYILKCSVAKPARCFFNADTTVLFVVSRTKRLVFEWQAECVRQFPAAFRVVSRFRMKPVIDMQKEDANAGNRRDPTENCRKCERVRTAREPANNQCAFR